MGGGILSLLFTNYIHHISYYIIAAKHTQLMGKRGESGKGDCTAIYTIYFIIVIIILLTNSAAAAASR